METKGESKLAEKEALEDEETSSEVSSSSSPASMLWSAVRCFSNPVLLMLFVGASFRHAGQ